MSGLLVSIMGAASDAVGSLTSMTRKGDAKPAGSADNAQAAFSALLAIALNPNKPQLVATTPLVDGTSELAEGGAEADEGGSETTKAPASPASPLGAVAGAAAAADELTASGGTGAANVERHAEPIAATAVTDSAVAGSAVAGIAAVAEPTNPMAVQTGMANLDPQFKERLERVVSRMRTEYGHEVRITETMRDQGRQNFLFAQGRSRPGPVVTWTKSSNHTVGRAADLMIDGTYDNPAGYKHLAIVAAEEGLQTLGSLDPGHVELPVTGRRVPRPMIETAGFAPARMVDVQASAVAERARTAAEAEVAPVAQVARVAHVAEVARVAQPGAAPVAVASTATDTRHESGSDNSNGSGSGEARPEIVRVEATQPQRSTFATTAVEALTRTAGLDASNRVAQIAQLQDGAATGPVNQILLRLDNAAGGEDRIRVDLRGTAVGASMDMASPADAERLTSRISELQRALENRGLEPEMLKVRSTTARDAAELIRMSNHALDLETQRSNLGSRNSSSDSTTRDRWESLAEEKSRQDAEDPREENRRNPKQEKK